MSIRDNMIQQVLGNPGKYSIQQLEAAMKSGSLPAYVVVPIIQDKVQQQKQMQAAMAMQQQPPQSTVAEQVMQEAGQMGGGVEQLPSNLPQEYAGGGIVAFEDGGMVERYQNRGLVESEEQRRAREAYEEANPFLRLLRKKELTEEEAAAIAAGATEQQRYYGKPDTSLTDAASAVGRGLRSLIPGAGEAAIPSGMEAEMGGGYQAPPVDTSLPTSLTRPDIMTGTSPRAAGPGAGGPSAAPAGFAGLGAGDFKRKSAVDEWQRQRYGTETEPGLEARSAARQRDLDAQIAAQKVPGLAYEGYEKALQKEEEARGIEKNEAKYTAMIKAGLAMMAGTSPNAFENIGKGALVGLEDWQRAAKDIKKAEKEHRMMMAQIEQARRAEKIGDRDKMIARLDSATKHAQRMDELGVEGYMRAFGVDQDAAQDAWGKRFSASTQIQIAREKGGTSTLLGLMRMGGTGEKGAMTALQRGNVMRELENSKPVLDYVAQLRKQRGSQVTEEEIAKAKNIKIMQEFEKYYGKGGVSGAAQSGFTPQEIEYLKQQGIAGYFTGLQ